MMDLSHAGLPEKESTVPGPYGQCRTQVARGDIGQNFKIRGGPMCKFSQDLYIFLVALNRICGFKWVKKIEGKLIQNMFLGPFISGCVIRPGPTCICKV